jgi:hypothetical protein
MTSKSTTIGEFILKQIQDNQNRDWDSIFKALGIFLLLFWICICIWVYFDVRTRYKRKLTAILVTLFVLVFNIPALIIYVVLRPEHTKEEIQIIKSANMFPISFDPKILGNTTTPLKLSFTLDVTPDPEGKNTPKINVTMLNTDSVKNILENKGEISQSDTPKVEETVKTEVEQVNEPTRLEAENVEIVEEKKKITFKERLLNLKERIKGLKIKKPSIKLSTLKFKKPIIKKPELKDSEIKSFLKYLFSFKYIPTYRGIDFGKLFKKKETGIIILPENSPIVNNPTVSEDTSLKSIAKSKKKKKNRRR